MVGVPVEAVESLNLGQLGLRATPLEEEFTTGELVLIDALAGVRRVSESMP